MRRYLIIIVMIGGLVLFQSSTFGNTQKPDGTKIALLMDALQVERWYTDRDVFVSTAEGLGAEVEVYVANSNPQKQLEQAEEAIAGGADILVLITADARKVAPILKAAKAKNVPVMAYDRIVANPDIALYVGFDGHMVGKLQAVHALKAHPEGQYAIICGPKRDNNSLLYHQGQYETIAPKVKSGDIELVYDEYMGEWAEMEGYMAATELLTMNPGVDVILAANDALASGVNMALEEHQMAGDVFVTGHDASVDGIQMLIDGNIHVNIYKPIKKLAQRAAQAAVKIAKGETIPDKQTLEFQGKSIPAILLEVIPVTKENYKETVIKDGHIDMSQLQVN